MALRPTFFNQVKLLVAALPQIHKEDCFALKGGTAINLFIRDMPRLSVDIDLAYIPLEDRDTSLKKIDSALKKNRKEYHSIFSRDTGGRECHARHSPL